jgi:predicted RNase H-like HicB family nuclease
LPTRTFHVTITKDENGSYCGRCQELPEVFALSPSLDELKEKVVVEIDLALRQLEEREAKE